MGDEDPESKKDEAWATLCQAEGWACRVCGSVPERGHRFADNLCDDFVGYMAKRVVKKPDWLKATNVVDIYSVSSCVSEDFTDYINYWKHNGYWFFDSPEIIRMVAKEHSIPIEGTSRFYYEAHELEFDDECWKAHSPDASFSTNVVVPSHKPPEGFDVVSFYARNAPENSS